MAAGDEIDADFQMELRGTLMGFGTKVVIDAQRGGLDGLLTNPGKAPESEYAHAAGSFIGEAHPASRAMTANLLIRNVTAAQAGTLLEEQEAVWAATGTEEEPLHFRLPGFGHRYVNGWPLGLIDVDITHLLFGVVPFAALFRITDPTIYSP